MGSVSFEFTSIGRFKTAQDAYIAECEEAQYEYGHDYYNGSISTTDGCSRESNAPRFGTRKFDGFIGNKLEKMGKGDCRYVEIEGTALKKLKERRGYKGKRNIKAFFFYGWARC